MGTQQEAIDGFAAALEQAMENDWLQQQYEERLFGAVFRQGEDLQRSLDETFARIEPVARQASQR
jgi:tripartite-type tricarboxylate transporter receptor subunit TctC